MNADLQRSTRLCRDDACSYGAGIFLRSSTVGCLSASSFLLSHSVDLMKNSKTLPINDCFKRQQAYRYTNMHDFDTVDLTASGRALETPRTRRRRRIGTLQLSGGKTNRLSSHHLSDDLEKMVLHQLNVVPRRSVLAAVQMVHGIRRERLWA
jgi:hypothetical protein